MRIVIFCHSLLSDWNHGNAHFLRGIASELIALGHQVAVFEPSDAWSVENLARDHGESALQHFSAEYPELHSVRYRLEELSLPRVLGNAELVLVHEWNAPELVRRIGEHHANHPNYSLFFHDTHHRSVTAPGEMATYDLTHYDAVLAFGEVVRQHYLRRGWARRAFTWHEAADVRKFGPIPATQPHRDLVWIGNFGDEERTAELKQFLIEPVRRLGISARVYGVRYSENTLRELDAAHIEYGGYLPNWDVPRVFAEHRVTVHVPRRPYVNSLPGIPTIRPFEAMACGIPLVSAPWTDSEGLFAPGLDYLVANDTPEMSRAIARILSRSDLAQAMTTRARSTILSRHTCAHRVQELLRFNTTIAAERASSHIRSSHTNLSSSPAR